MLVLLYSNNDESSIITKCLFHTLLHISISIFAEKVNGLPLNFTFSRCPGRILYLYTWPVFLFSSVVPFFISWSLSPYYNLLKKNQDVLQVINEISTWHAKLNFHDKSNLIDWFESYFESRSRVPGSSPLYRDWVLTTEARVWIQNRPLVACQPLSLLPFRCLSTVTNKAGMQKRQEKKNSLNKWCVLYIREIIIDIHLWLY